jgi:hypothetical protein
MAIKEPDDVVVAIFKNVAFRNDVKSAAAGRPVFDDMEVVELRFPGTKNWGAYLATDFSHWAIDPETGSQVRVTYAERFRRQYQQFKSHVTQTKSGTPLDYAMFLTEARRAELRAQNIYTIEALASIDGQELKNLGQGGRDMKNSAMEYIQSTKTGSISTQVQAELEALRARNASMEEDLAALKAKAGAAPVDEFDEMDLAQLREYITAQTGQAPLGALNTKTLRRMARDCAPEKASAA